MDFLSREAIISEMSQSLEELLRKYDLEDIGVFEEEGEANRYYLGYTIRRNGNVHMVHLPFMKNDQGNLAPIDDAWVVESENGDTHGYQSLEDAFNSLGGEQ